MFPEPVDPGIAQPDRAASSVEHGTDTGPKGEWRNEVWYHGSGKIGEKAVERIQIYPPTHGVQTQGDPWEPVSIGILVDMELGQLLADWIDPTILAIEDAMNEGVYQRGPIELVTVDARGLPSENYLKVQKGYEWLVEQGCVVVLGPMISDNSVNIRDLVNQTGVACIGWTGSTRFDGEYCFTVANGDIPTEGVMGAHWCKNNGYEKVGFFWELGLVGHRLPRLVPRTRHATSGSRSSTPCRCRPTRSAWPTAWRRCATVVPTPSCTWATATRRSTSSAGSTRSSWDPPRFMGTAFMFYSNTNEWAQGLEGWHGVDQLGEDGTNPNYEALVPRIRKPVRPRRRERGRRPRVRHRAGRDPWHRQRHHRAPQGGEARAREDQVDALHQRRAGHLRDLCAARPPGLQGRLPHHPSPPQRQVRVRRLPPSAVAQQLTQEHREC